MYLRVEGVRNDDSRVVGVERFGRFEKVALVVVAVVERRRRRKDDDEE